MKIDIEKEKLPKGLSYALKTSTIERVLVENQIDTYVHLIYSKSKIFFDAHYWLPNENVDYFRLYVRAGSVQSNQRKDAEIYMNNIVIPAFVVWAKRLTKLPENSTELLSENYFCRNFK